MQIIKYKEDKNIQQKTQKYNKINTKYPEQSIFVVNIEGYAHLVPYVENGETIFLKTVIPSRKATKQYLGGSDE